jgi:hypothetical protein
LLSSNIWIAETLLIQDWRLNARHWGALQGKTLQEAADEFGKEMVCPNPPLPSHLLGRWRREKRCGLAVTFLDAAADSKREEDEISCSARGQAV